MDPHTFEGLDVSCNCYCYNNHIRQTKMDIEFDSHAMLQHFQLMAVKIV